MYFWIIVMYVVIYGAWGSVWGWAVNKIIQNKGYRENWFWWGFFFGMIALLVALTKPDLPRSTEESSSYFGEGGSIVGPNYVFRGFGAERKADYTKGEWRCTHCGAVNANYVGTCGCGWDKSGNAPGKSSGQSQPVRQSQAQQLDDTQTEQPQMFYCTSCGKQMSADSRFCRFCGAKVET